MSLSFFTSFAITYNAMKEQVNRAYEGGSSIGLVVDDEHQHKAQSSEQVAVKRKGRRLRYV